MRVDLPDVRYRDSAHHAEDRFWRLLTVRGRWPTFRRL